MMIIVNSECCGCGLCAQICPQKCIVMKPDSEGFLTPQIIADKCIRCNLCKTRCPVNNAQDYRSDSTAFAKKCFYAISADKTQVATASSGGIFPQLAQNILKKGGAVVGAAFNDQFNVSTILIEDASELPKLLQAKYVQSEISPGLFAEARNILQMGRPLLFAGTPCQIAAFRSYCDGQQYPELLCVDLICHGVPSPAVWQSYLKSVKKQIGETIKSISFRDKIYGWHKYALTIAGSSDTLCQIHKESPYMQLYLNELISRNSCSVCAFKNGKSGADLSLGDFWKLRKIASEMDNNTGVSMVIAHSENGMAKLKECDLARLEEFPMATVKKSNSAYSTSIPQNPLRKKYFSDFAEGQQQWIDPTNFLSRKNKHFLHRLLLVLSEIFKKVF